MLEDDGTKTIGQHSYTIRTARVETKRHQAASQKSLSQRIVKIVATPFALATGTLAMAFMYLAPQFIRNKLSWYFTSILCGRYLDRIFATERTELLRHVSGRVLDIGAGSGSYIKYYGSRAQHVVALEPNVECHASIRKECEKYVGSVAHNNSKETLNEANPPRTILAMDTEVYLESVFRASKSPQLFDWVILGNVMCEISDHPALLLVIDEMLRPNGGMIYFCEHVACRNGTWGRTFQNLINPFWRTLSNGCNCNKDSIVAMEAMENWKITSWTYEHFRIGFGPLVIGLIEKLK